MSPGRTKRDLTLSLELAQRLRDAGLRWQPHDGDLFHIPDRGFDNKVFTISEMVVEVRDVVGERELAFNGTVEWALDSILKAEVVWVPTEGQLRTLLADDFIALFREDDGAMSCVARVDGRPVTYHGATAADAYGHALLALLGAQPNDAD